MKERDKK